MLQIVHQNLAVNVDDVGKKIFFAVRKARVHFWAFILVSNNLSLKVRWKKNPDLVGIQTQIFGVGSGTLTTRLSLWKSFLSIDCRQSTNTSTSAQAGPWTTNNFLSAKGNQERIMQLKNNLKRILLHFWRKKWHKSTMSITDLVGRGRRSFCEM